MFAEIAELFLCKIFQIVIKFMNQNKLLCQRQHQGLDRALGFNPVGSLFVAERNSVKVSVLQWDTFRNLYNGVRPLINPFMGSPTNSFKIVLFVEFEPVLRCFYFLVVAMKPWYSSSSFPSSQITKGNKKRYLGKS